MDRGTQNPHEHYGHQNLNLACLPIPSYLPKLGLIYGNIFFILQLLNLHGLNTMVFVVVETMGRGFYLFGQTSRIFCLFKRASWLMQLKHLKMFVFKTYLGLARIANNMALIIASWQLHPSLNPQELGSNQASHSVSKAILAKACWLCFQ